MGFYQKNGSGLTLTVERADLGFNSVATGNLRFRNTLANKARES